MNFSSNYKKLYTTISDLYHTDTNRSKLVYSGWHHIQFVHDKAVVFAEELKCNIEQVAVSALVHDLNYIFSEKLEPEAANLKITEYLIGAGYDNKFAEEVLKIIENSHMAYRGSRSLSDESKALSDADTLFKSLPLTPILLASKYLIQNKLDIESLANKIINEQKPLIDSDTYFYTYSAKQKYMNWAQTAIKMWENVLESLKDDDVKQMLKNAKESDII